jgi:peptide-methionine (R)-S-oxide reductase
MKRRGFLAGLVGLPLTLALGGRAFSTRTVDPAGAKTLSEIQNNWKALLAEGADVTLSTTPIKKSPMEWKQILSAQQFNVLREEGTERPHSSPLNTEKRAGVFACAGCGLPLFTSAMKFDSGTGWPSFFTSIPGHLATKTDYKLIWPRTEYHCVRCGGHHGHVFDDGPPPTGQRWCNNGVALKFIPAQEKA